MLGLTLLRALLALVLILGHDILKVTPQRFDGCKLSADLGDFFERAVQLVDVLEYGFEALEARSVSRFVERTAVCSGVCEAMRGGGCT